MKNLKYVLLLAAACAFSSCAKEPETQNEAPQTPGSSIIGGEIVNGWVRIKLQDGAQPLKVGAVTRGETLSGNSEIDRIAEELGAVEVVRVFEDGGKFAERRRRYGLHLWYELRFDESIPVTRAMTSFGSAQGIQVIEPIYREFSLSSDVVSVPIEMMYSPANVITRPTEMPFNDPRLNEQWHYNNIGSSTNYVLGADINLFAAWKEETGKPSVIVSVHDEGVDVKHDDLAANIWVNLAEKNGTAGVDDDNNGYTDDLNGWSYVNSSGIIPAETHGTHVSGTIAAVNNNGIGVAGVAGGNGTADSGARIMVCNIIPRGGAVVPRTAESYVYAADNGSVISQNSWTLGTTGELSRVYVDAFNYFKENAGVDEKGNQTGPMKGGIIIFASANSGVQTLLPAASELVIGVAATGPKNELTVYSNRGPEIDISAPGGQGQMGSIQVLSLDKNNSYSALWGTSMACPHVSGVTALIVSKFGKAGFTVEECEKRLRNAYRPLGATVDELNIGNVGAGLLDAAAALMNAPSNKPNPVESAIVTTATNNLKFSWTAPADGHGMAVRKYIVSYEETNAATSRVEDMTTVVLVNNSDVGATSTHSLKVKYNKKYNIKIYAEDRYGLISSEVNLTATTENFVNKAPVRRKSIPDSSISAPGTNNKLSFALVDYISDPNTSQGDVLTYTVVSATPSIAKGKIVDGRMLEVIPVAKGTTNVTIIATDIAGESVKLSFVVTVLSGPAPQIGGTVIIFPNPVQDNLKFELSDVSSSNVDVVIYDAASRKVLSKTEVAIDANGRGAIDVSKLSAGTYSFVVRFDGVQINSGFVKK